MLDKENERALLNLRSDITHKAITSSGLMKILLKYFPMGTTITITKDYFKINEPCKNEDVIDRIKRMGE